MINGTGLIINGERVLVPGLNVINYLDDHRCALFMGKNMRLRNTRWIRAIIHHNTKNVATVLLPGAGPSEDLGARLMRFWSLNTTKPAGAHTAVDWDGTVFCLADLMRMAAYHASMENEVSVGNEMFEDEKGHIYQVQLDANVKLTEFLCHYFGIQRQCPPSGYTAQINRLSNNLGHNCGVDMVGVFGHCHQNHPAKANDPGIHIFQALVDAGFHTFDFNHYEDKNYWKTIQDKLGVNKDGVPGPHTRDALHAHGFEAGLYDFVTAL